MASNVTYTMSNDPNQKKPPTAQGWYDTFAAQNPGQYGGMPDYPTYMGMEPDALNLAGRAESMYGNVNPDRRALSQFNNEAMRTGPSQGAKLATQGQRYMAARGRDDAKLQQAGELAQARTALATKGGMRSGAAERMATSVANRGMDLNQQGRDTSAKANMQIGMEDEKNRVGELGNAVGMNQSAANFDLGKTQGLLGTYEGDINRNQLENTKANAFNLQRYGSQMQAWGAGKQADATANAGKK